MDESVGEAVVGGPESAGAGPARSRSLSDGAGRLALSVVVDGRANAADAAQVARLIGRLQLAGVWWRQPPVTGSPASNVAGLLDLLWTSAAPASAGLIVAAGHVSPDLIGRLQGPVEASEPAVRLAVCDPASLPVEFMRTLADHRHAMRVALARPSGPDALPGAATAIFVPIAADRDLGASVAAAAAVAAGRPVLVEVAVSVGRTSAEASARTIGDELFTVVGHPAEQGLFGTLEECQADAASLAQMGATELLCHLPRSPDLPDVLAQLRAISIGAGLLRPGEPASSPPPPPVGWGGRRTGPN
jgi:hypothetical protein